MSICIPIPPSVYFNKAKANQKEDTYDIQFVSIEGNIGSGKSTLLSNLKTKLEKKPYTHVIFLQEPVDEWTTIKDEHGKGILEKFYNDQEKYSFSFQLMAYISRVKLLKKAVDEIKKVEDLLGPNNNTMKTKWIIITERSLYTDKMVFAQMLFDSGKIEYINHQIYLQWFDTFADDFKINKIVYIKANPDTCHERIVSRNRTGEQNIALEYLTKCNEYHDIMMDKNNHQCVCQNQLVLDGNINIHKHKDTLQDWISQITEFIQ